MNLPLIFKKATKLHEKGNLIAAKSSYLKILKKHPNHPEALRLLAVIYLQQKKPQKALESLTKSIKYNPSSIPAHINLVSTYSALGNNQLAIESSKKILSLSPNNHSIYFNLGNLYRKELDFENAIKYFKQTLEVNPLHKGCLLNLGHIHKNLGEIEKAKFYYEQILENSPDLPEVYWALSNLKSYTFSDEQISAMNNIAKNTELSEAIRLPIFFALSQAYEYRHDYTTSFTHLKTGNDIKNKNLKTVDYTKRSKAIKNCFNKSFLDTHKLKEACTASPIFIVSLPRSGSTLVEQILASHSKVIGASETFAVSKIIAKNSKTSKLDYPDFIKEPSAKYFQEFRDSYLESTQKWHAQSALFTDKTPENIDYIGLISILFPKATIINVRRNPMDNCLSCYRQLFANGNEFSYSLKNLADYFHYYIGLMDYWKKNVPNKIIDVHYEDLIDQPQTNIIKLLDECNLGYEDSCLEFYKTKRQIRTASAGQVIQPIYKNSNNRWLNYKEFIHELETNINKPPAHTD